MSASIGLPGMGIMGREVYPNSKCESCMHYSRLSGLRGACTKGLAPASCGSGDMPVAGYFPLVGSGLEHGPGVDPTHTPDGDSGPPLGADAPHVEVLEHRVGTAYDGLVKALVEGQVKYMRTGCPMHNFSMGLTAVGGATAKSCSCNPVQLEPIAQALQNAIPQGKQLGIEDEAFLEFAFKATERVFPTSDKPGPPSVYLPGVHSPASPVRKTKKKVLAKAVHPLTVSYDRTFKEAVAHAGELSKPGPGGKSDVGTKLLQAARQHVDVGMKLKDYPGSDKAAAHHWQLAAEHAGTPRGHAHVAIANAYEHVGKAKKSFDSEGVDGWQEDLAKAETLAIPEAVRSAETWDGKKKAAMEAVRSNRLDHRSHSRQAAIHTNLETKFAESGDETQAQLHGAMALAHSVHADHAPDAKFLPTKLAKATNQPHLPDDVRWKAREMQRQGVKIGADHPLAHAVRSAAKEHVGSSYKHFGQQDHAQHVAFHHEAGQVAAGYEKPAHDALAAAHTTYGKTKTQLTYKAHSVTKAYVKAPTPKDVPATHAMVPTGPHGDEMMRIAHAHAATDDYTDPDHTPHRQKWLAAVRGHVKATEEASGGMTSGQHAAQARWHATWLRDRHGYTGNAGRSHTDRALAYVHGSLAAAHSQRSKQIEHREKVAAQKVGKSVDADLTLLFKFEEIDKAYSGIERNGIPEDETIEKFHRTHHEVNEAAKKAHAAGVGVHSYDPNAYNLRHAAIRHALIGQQFDHHVDSAHAAAYHHGRADGFGDTHHGLAARAIAHAYENQPKDDEVQHEVHVAKSLLHGKLVAKSESSKLAAKIAHSAHQHEYINYINNRSRDTQSDHALPKFERAQGHLANAIHHAHGAALASNEHGDARGIKRAMKAARGYMKDHKQFFSRAGFGGVHDDLKKQHRKVLAVVKPKTIEASGHYSASAKKLTAGNVGEH